MKSTFFVLAFLLVLGILSACGQSGPLYVPGDPSSVQSPQQPAEDDDSEENGEDDDR